MSKFSHEIKGYKNKIKKFNVLPFICIENDQVALSIKFGWLFWTIIFWKMKDEKKKTTFSKRHASQIKSLLEK
jgi:hypothetical protein